MPQKGEKNWIPGTVVKHHEYSCSYVVQVGNRQLRRNRKHLRLSTDKAHSKTEEYQN